MATTNFVSGTLIESTWLNDVDAGIYETLPAVVAESATTTAGLAAHIVDTTAAHIASAIANTPAGSIAATTVQAAIDELDAEKQPLDAQLTTLAGITAQQATDLASVSTFMGTTLNDADAATFRATTGTEPALIAESTVSGAAVTSIQFTGLDISTHKSYRIEIEYVPASTATALAMYINGDTTATNYYSQYILASGAVVSAARTNVATIFYLIASVPLSANAFVYKNSAGQVHATSDAVRAASTTLELIGSAYAKTATVTNITQLDFVADVALSIGIGSTIRIYRGDK